jgi:hypothetical protein
VGTSIFGNIRGQEQEREYMEYRDKVGRLFHTQIERKTGDPCQVLRALDWTAPLNPDWLKGELLPPLDDIEIVRMVPKAARARLGYQVEIHYERWLAKWDEAMEAWEKKLQDFARGLSKQENPLSLINNPTPELLKIMGPKPWPPRPFIEAAAAGNEWALGLSDVVPRKAQPILEMLKPMLIRTAAERRTSTILDPFAEDFDTDDDDLPPSLRQRPRVHDPLGDDDEDQGSLASFATGQALEEQFNPENVGGGKVTKPAAVAGGKKTTKAKPDDTPKKSARPQHAAAQE